MKMPNIKLIKEPGYIFDLLFIFFLKYNTEYCMEMFVNQKKETEDKEFYQQILKDFSPISDDLYVFFHAQKNGRCFFVHSYFDHYKNNFTSDYNFEFLQRELSNYEEVVRRAVQFYFYDLSEEEMETCIHSNVKFFEVIKNSDYTDTEKSRFYEFFINPSPYIQKLQYELMAKEVQLSAYYEKNYLSILDAYNQLTIDILIDQLKPLKDLSFFKNDESQLLVSFCLINRECIRCMPMVDASVYLLGNEYMSGIEAIQSACEPINLYEVGTALSEESRVKMLDLMLEKNEITCKDLERTFNFSGSTAYHHLTILLKYGVIKTRNEGKTIFYSVNNKSFDAVIDVLNKYSSNKKGTMQ